MHRSALTSFVVAAAVSASACAPAPPAAPSAAALARLAPEQLLDSLSLRDRIAQLVMPWIAGSYASFDDAALVRAEQWVDSLHVGGIIVSIGSPLDVAAKINHLQKASRLPLLIASDLEAGTAIRLTGGTAFPTNMGVGADGREMDAYEMGRVTALEGRAVGIRLAFAPVADVNNNPANPIINTRSFGEDPHAVAALVAAEVRGLQEHGMLATAKHFPGHGNTGTDSHLTLPVIASDYAELDSVELVPFRAAVAAGVGAVMSGHIALPGIDSGRTRPGTLSPVVLTGLLRDSLQFQGLAVTDALDMGALVNGYGAGEAAVQAFLAGTDLLLQPADPAVVIAAMEQAVKSGRITEDRLNRSVLRVLRLKRQMGLFRDRTVPLDSVPAVVGQSAFKQLAADVTARSIVLARDSGGVVDSLRAHPRPVTLITFGDENTPAAGTGLTAGLRNRGYPVTSFRLWPASGPASYDSARAVIAAGSARGATTLFATSVRVTAWRGSVALPDSLGALIDTTAQLTPTVLITFGSPYVIMQTPHVGSYLLAWTANPLTEAAAAAALTGAPVTGRLPIHIPPDLPLGAGLQRPGVISSDSSALRGFQ